MARSFDSIQALRAGIAALQADSRSDERAMNHKFSKGKMLKTGLSLIKPVSPKQDDQPVDLVQNVSRVVVPMLLNVFVFRGSGFLAKAAVTIISQQAAKHITKENVGHVVDSFKEYWAARKVRKHKVRFADYGIPPDSETY